MSKVLMDYTLGGTLVQSLLQAGTEGLSVEIETLNVDTLKVQTPAGLDITAMEAVDRVWTLAGHMRSCGRVTGTSNVC